MRMGRAAAESALAPSCRAPQGHDQTPGEAAGLFCFFLFWDWDFSTRPNPPIATKLLRPSRLYAKKTSWDVPIQGEEKPKIPSALERRQKKGRRNSSQLATMFWCVHLVPSQPFKNHGRSSSKNHEKRRRKLCPNPTLPSWDAPTRPKMKEFPPSPRIWSCPCGAQLLGAENLSLPRATA